MVDGWGESITVRRRYAALYGLRLLIFPLYIILVMALLHTFEVEDQTSISRAKTFFFGNKVQGEVTAFFVVEIYR